MALTAYFEAQKNLTYEMFCFQEMKKVKVSLFFILLRLRDLAGRCDFHDKEREKKEM